MSEGSAWVTLATNDSYCLGALVLAHSLRRANTAHPIVILITPGVTPIMRERLSHVFSEVINVDVLDSGDSAHLALLARPELGITFTKLHCWTLTQYNKCVFLDADTLVLQNCDELFEREELSAAPDVGWPDCFNSGVFVYRPSNETFTSLLEFAKKNGSFDGGDQGLLNQYFSSWATGDISKHLSFLYNVCSTSFYSYLPALKQYGENMKIVHFIGQVKPWLENFNWGSRTVGSGSGTLQGPLQFWWDIFIDQVHPVLDVAMPSCKGTGSCCSNGKCETVGEARSFYAPPPNSQFPWHRPITPPPTPDQHQHNIHAHFIDPWEIYQPQRQEQHHHNTGYVQHVQHNNQHVNNEHQHNNQHIHHGQQHIHHGQQHNEYVHHGHQHNEHVHHEQQHHNEYVHHGHQHNNDYVHHGQQHNEYVHHEPQHNNEYVHHDHHHNEYVHHEHQHNEHVHHEHQHNEHVHHDNNYHVEEQKNIYPPKPWYEYYTNEPEEQNNDSQNVNDTMSLCDISNCEPGGTNCSKEHLEENGCHESCQHDNINDDDDILSLIEEEVRPRHPYDNFYLIHRVVIDPQGRKMCMHEVPPKVPTPPPSPSPPPSPTPEEDTQGGVASALSQMTIGSSQGGSAMDEHLRRQGWETGNIDYMGADAFDNIWAKISQTLSIAPASSGPSAPEEPTPVPQPPPVHEKVEPVAPQECLTESRSSMESFEQVSSGVTPTVSDISISKPSSLENSSESSFTTVSSATPSQTKQSSAGDMTAEETKL